METRKIGNFEVTDKDLDLFIVRLPQEQQMYAQMPDFRKQCEERLLEIIMFAAYGEDSKIEETDVYKEALALARRDILGQMAMQQLLGDVTVSDDEVKEYFEAHKESFNKPANAGAKHILVDTEEKANEIKAQIEKEEISFEDAAKEHSSCPSSAQGGDLGAFGPGQMVPEFDQAVFNAEVGELLGPVKTQFGYHLITVTALNPASESTFEESKETAKQQALMEKQNKIYEAKVAELKEKYL